MMNNSTSHSAAEYDVQVRRTIPFYDVMHELVLSLAAAWGRPIRDWLDTGCGTGGLAENVLSIFPDVHMVLADPSEAMIEEAALRFSGDPRVRILRPVGTGDLGAYLQGKFDIITAVQCHHYLQPDERLAALRVCRDLLVPGGMLLTFENIKPLTQEGLSLGFGFWGGFQRMAGKSDSEIARHRDRFGNEYFPVSVDDHRQVLQQAGFRAIEPVWLSVMQAGFAAFV